MPAPAAEILVAMEVAVREDVEPRPLFVADDDRQRILKLLAEANVHHAGVERPRPHAHVEPARPRPRTGDGARQDQVFRHGESHRSLTSTGGPLDVPVAGSANRGATDRVAGPPSDR